MNLKERFTHLISEINSTAFNNFIITSYSSSNISIQSFEKSANI